MTQREHSILNLLRFLAAFWILVFHAQIHFGKIPELHLAHPLIDQGVLAMTLFFMLSGFVLSMRYSDFSSSEKAKSFFSARISRLYPVYLFMGLVTAWSIPLSYDIFQIPSLGLFPSVLWTIFIVFVFAFALQAWLPSLFSVWNFGGSWSLSAEAFFYALFPFLRTKISSLNDSMLRFLCFALVATSLAVAIGLLAGLNPRNHTTSMFYVVPIYRLPEFIFGIVIYIAAVERRLLGIRSIFIAFFFLLFGMGAIHSVGNLPGYIEYSSLFMPMFAVIFVWSLDRRLPWRLDGMANYLGHISYCVYIVQFGTVPIFKNVLEDHNEVEKWLIFICVNLGLAIMVHHGVERLFYSRVRNYIDNKLELKRRAAQT